MIRRSLNGIHWLEFELFQKYPLLKHGIFLRRGGCSLGPYSSLNLSYSVRDNPEHVQSNLNKVQELLSVKELCWSSQIHGKIITKVEKEWKNGLVASDGLMTKERNKGLLIHHADCQAAIFYDPIQHVVATVHCGWRGSLLNIYSETVQKMQQAFGSKPQHLLVGISPSLGPENAEFIYYKTELPKAFWQFQIKPFYFDFWAISINQLLECGLQRVNIQVANICTYANPEDFFSYRYSKIKGGNATIAILLDK